MPWTNPTTRTTGDLITASIWNTDLVDDLTYIYTNAPLRAMLWTDENIVTAGAAYGITVDSSQRYAFYAMQSSPANNDAFTQSFLLKAGTYTLYVLGETSTDHGIMEWYIDDVLAISAQDWYSASLTRNIVKSGSVTVTGSGRHKLTGKINGKHASSTNYYYKLTKMWLVPSADSAGV